MVEPDRVTGSDAPTWPDTRTPRQRHLAPAFVRNRRLLTALLLALAVGLMMLSFAAWPRHHRLPQFCAGVGVFGPTRSSPDAALAAFLAKRAEEPPAAAWHRRPGPGEQPSGSAWYDNTTRQHGKDGSGDWALSVVRGPLGWAVDGACV
jgi:hypothetical protein